MNEKIKQLAEQAGGHFGDGLEFAVVFGELDDFKKFAELIVKECMDCSSWVGKVNTNSVEPIHTAHAINQRIKQHFGVEE